MVKRLIPYIILILFCLPQSSEAQRWKLRRYEALFGVGFANYFGDIGGSAESDNWFGLKDLQISGTRPIGFVGARFKIRSNMSVRANVFMGYLQGSDEGSKNNDRGFEFASRIIEPSVRYEYSLISEEQRRRSGAMFNKRGMMNNYSQINLYLYAGIGGVFFNAKVNDALKASPYYDPDHPKAALVIPGGVGLKYVISQSWSVGIEFGPQWTSTDYLDGYASPWSKANDLYYIGHVHGIYRLKTSRDGWPQFLSGGRKGFR